MTVRTVVVYPNPVLRTTCTSVDSVDESVLELVQDLKDTCKAKHAQGLAAPQLGDTRRVFVTLLDGAEPAVFINPVLSEKLDPVKMNEGCLSFPGVEEVIPRFSDLVITALDESGESFTLSLDGIEAVAVQHEVDHLNGVLFIDHVSPLKRRIMVSRAAKHIPKKGATKRPVPSKRAAARQERKRQRTHKKRFATA